MKKRVVSVIIALALVLALIPAAAFADETEAKVCHDLYCQYVDCDDVFEVAEKCVLRSGPGKSYSKRGELSKGDFVRVLSYTTNKYGNLWASIDYDGDDTYIFVDHLAAHSHEYHVVKDDSEGYFAYCKCGNYIAHDGDIVQQVGSYAATEHWIGSDMEAARLWIEAAVSGLGATAGASIAVLGKYVLVVVIIGGTVYLLYMALSSFTRIEKVRTIELDKYQELTDDLDGYIPCTAFNNSSCSMMLMPYSMDEDAAAKYLIAASGVDAYLNGIYVPNVSGYSDQSGRLLVGVYTPQQSSAKALCEKVETMTGGVLSYGSSKKADHQYECNFSDACFNHFHLHCGAANYLFNSPNQSTKVSGIHVFFGGKFCNPGRYFA